MAKSEPTDIDSITGGRVRTFTENGRELYESQTSNFLSQIDKSWECVELLLEEFSECGKELKPLRELEKKLLAAREVYVAKSDEYIQFLIRKKIEETQITLVEFKHKCIKCIEIIDNTIKQIKALKLEISETLSVSGKTTIKD